jgi:hypothetical protein
MTENASIRAERVLFWFCRNLVARELFTAGALGVLASLLVISAYVSHLNWRITVGSLSLLLFPCALRAAEVDGGCELST